MYTKSHAQIWSVRTIIALLVPACLLGLAHAEQPKHPPQNGKMIAAVKPTPIMTYNFAEPETRQDPNDKQADHRRRVVELARTDHIALFQWALQNYRENIHDYTLTFYKQERIKGKLKDRQTISVSFRERPFSVLMEWDDNADSIDKLLYVEGQNKNKMLVHPTGFFSWIKSVKKDPDCKDARKSSLKTCDEFGFRRSMESLLSIYLLAQKSGDLEFSCLGTYRILDRDCVRLERRLPNKKEYPCARMVIDLDVERLVPVALTSYDWDGKLIARYLFDDLKVNNGLTTLAFAPKTNKL